MPVTNRIRGLWIDDRPEEMRLLLDALNRVGIPMELEPSPAIGIRRLKLDPHGYSHVFLDLDMDEMDGVKTYNRIRKFHKQIPIFVVSAHSNEHSWERRLQKEISEPVARIDKPIPMETDPKFSVQMNRVRRRVEAYLSGGELEGLFQWEIDPFLIPLEEFYGYSDPEQETLFDLAERKANDFVATYFSAHGNADWLVIRGGDGNVVATGPAHEHPTEAQLDELAREGNHPVFLFSRAKAIEEFHTAWSEKNENGDFYPTVEIAINDCTVVGDFDTGSEVSFLSYEHARELGIASRMVWQGSSGTVWGQRYRYYFQSFDGFVADTTKRKAIVLRCELVKRWLESPQGSNYPRRIALIGRNFVLENELLVVLDGRARSTYFSGE